MLDTLKIKPIVVQHTLVLQPYALKRVSVFSLVFQNITHFSQIGSHTQNVETHRC